MEVTAELILMADSLKTIVCRNVIRLAKQDGLSGIQLARMLDVAPPNVSRWLNYKARPDDMIIDRMREVLSWRLDELTWEPESESEPPPVRSKKRDKLDLVESVQNVLDALGFEKPRLKKKSQ